MTADDMELVREYARSNSEAAFATLVERHINLVYSVALRRAADTHLAQEITQAVFIILARKANALGAKTILPGWLCRTAHYVSANALTTRRRRQHYEQEALMQSLLNEPDCVQWNQIAPLLEDALARLNKKDYDAVVLRFFENRSFSEVGSALGIKEDTARMRIGRALEKLRKYYFKRGVDSTTAVIAGAISAHSIQAAPAGLAKSVSAVAMAKGTVASASTLSLIKGALKLMAWSKAKTAAVAGAILIFAAGTTAISLVQVRDYTRYHTIAKTLLNMHHEWSINGYKAKGMTIPRSLYKDNWSSYSAGILGAMVLYHYTNNGIEWDKWYQVWRPDTNTTTWTLFEVGYPVDTNLARLAWRHKLATVTGNP
jgi:RNA polymerase sigma factor (sigma-70 family)